MLLETERLVLSGWAPHQVDDLVRLHGNPDVARYLSISGKPWIREQAEKAVASWIALFETSRLGKMRLTRKSDGAFVGRAGFGIDPATGAPEIGFALFSDQHGQGYASEAASALRDWLFAETDAPHFLGYADTRNAPSLAVLRKIGMTPTHVAPLEAGGHPFQFHIHERPAAHD